MNDLETRLREWADEELAAAPDVPFPQWDQPRTLRGRWVVALAAAAAAIVGLAVVAVLVRSRHGDAPAVGTTPAELTGVTWRDEDANSTVLFTDTTMKFSDGCVGVTSYVSFDGDRFTVGAPVPQSSYGCAGTPVPQPGSPDYATYQRRELAEQTLDDVLDSSPSWSVDGGTLTLTDDGTVVRLVDSGHAATYRGLAGTSWQLVSATPGRRTPFVVASTALSFGKGLTFHGETSCTVVTGRYAVNGAAVRFSDLVYADPRCQFSRGGPQVPDAGLWHFSFKDSLLIIVSERGDRLVYLPA